MQAKKQDGAEYKHSSLLDMVRGILRHINAEYKISEINGKAALAARQPSESQQRRLAQHSC
jgi:hypothetical protein